MEALSFLNLLFFMLLQLLVAIAIVPLFDGIARSLRAKIQSRVGVPIYQTYYDLFKLLTRGRTIPNCTHFFFRIAPYLMFVLCSMLVMIMPITYTNFSEAGAISDILVIVYLVAFFRFVFGVSGIDSGSTLAGVGASRESLIAIYVEPIMIICLIIIALLCGSTNLPLIKTALNLGEVGYFIPSFTMASVAFLWAMYVEMGRKPFDVAEAETEIHEGVVGEYSGKDLALVEMAMMLKQYAMISFFITLFVPLGMLVGDSVILSLVANTILALIFYVGAILIDNFGPRYKILTSLKFNASGILLISFMALILYAFGV